MDQSMHQAIRQMLPMFNAEEDSRERAKQIFRDAYCAEGDVVGFVEEGFLASISEHDGDSAEAMLDIAFSFDLFKNNETLLPHLISLVNADWHSIHERLVFALGEIGSNETLTALNAAVFAKPSYLVETDETLILVRRALWAIWKIGSPEAMKYLSELSRSPDGQISHLAKIQIEVSR